MSYRYLFPFEKVNKGADILIYGAGILGQEYLKQMLISRYCNVIGMVDRNYKQYPSMAVPMYAPSDIHTLEFDYVVIALRIDIGSSEIRRVLKEQGVPEEKIVCVFERNEDALTIWNQNESMQEGIVPAYDKTECSIALLITGGIGDNIIQKRFLMELVRLVPDVRIDLYSVKTGAFLSYLYSDMENINGVIDDLGSRYSSNNRKYALSMVIEACNYIQIDEFKESFWMEKNRFFGEKIVRLKAELEKEDLSLKIPVHVSNLRRQYCGCNAYTGFSYGGIFDIRDKKVTIPLNPEMEQEVLGYGRYITVNYGNGECRDGSKIAKMWPQEYFENVIARLHEQFPQIKILQLGDNNAIRLKGIDKYCLGETFDKVASVLKHAIFHLDIEGGLVHFASQTGTRCIVLFGPTVAEYYGYENNINIRAGECHNCWGLYTDVNKCARHMEKPECMYAIKPELVLEHAVKVLNGQVVDKYES